MIDCGLRWLRRLVALAIIVNIVTGSLYPLAHDVGLNLPDKIQHFIAYFALAFVLGLSSRPVIWRLFYMGLAVALGGVIEIIQPFVGRDMSFADLYADAAGVALGGVCGIIARPMIARFLGVRLN